MSRKILITGASTGIGAATARALAQNSEIFIHYNRSEAEARRVAQEVEALGGKASVCQADLMEEAGCRSLYDQVKAKTNTLDVLVNNAGGLLARHTVQDVTWALMEQIFALNTFSTMLMTQ